MGKGILVDICGANEEVDYSEYDIVHLFDIKNTTGYARSNGLFCHSSIVGSILFVILLTIPSDNPNPYISCMCEEMSLVVIPFAYMEMI